MRAAITAAFAFGFNAGAPPQKQAAVTFADVPTFDAAINALVSKKVVSRATVDAMEEKAKSRAFYVSRLAELETVGRVKDYLVKNLKDKTSFQNFIKNLDKDELLKKAGWEENGGWYWETVYRTNTMSAFNAGRAEAFEEYEPEYLEFIGIEDFRQTPVCAARSGIVKKRTDPFWKKNFPPLHFNCRSTVRPVYAEEADAFGIKESAEVSFPNAPAKGFGHNPAAEWNEVTEEVKERWIESGGIREKSYEEQNRHALMYYEEIRNRKNPEQEIKRISKKVNAFIKKTKIESRLFSEKDIKAIRNHVFINEYELEKGIGRFDVSLDTALTWQRLDTGRTIDPLDVMFLNHEFKELTMMRELGYNYKKAHVLTDIDFPWGYYINHHDWDVDRIQEIAKEQAKPYL